MGSSAAFYHTSTPIYARQAVAEVLDVVPTTPSDQVVIAQAKRVLTPEEIAARKALKRQKEEEVKKMVDSLGCVDYCNRLKHLFLIRRLPGLKHYHMVLEKIQHRRHLNAAINLLKYYQAFAIETKEETAKLFVEAGMRTGRLREVFELFGKPREYRLWPTPELCGLVIDYFLEQDNRSGAWNVLSQIRRRVDITIPTETLKKMFDYADRHGYYLRGLSVLNYARLKNIPCEPDWYDRLLTGFWSKRNLELLFRVEKRRVADGAPLTITTATMVLLAHLAQGKLQEAAAYAVEAITSTQRSAGWLINPLIAPCMARENVMRKPFEEFVKLLPPDLPRVPTGLTTADYAMQLWQKQADNRAKLPKQADSRQKERYAVWAEKMKLVKAERKKRKEERRIQEEQRIADKLQRIKELRQIRRKRTAKLRSARRQERKLQKAAEAESRIESRRTKKARQVLIKRPDKRMGRKQKKMLLAKLWGKTPAKEGEAAKKKAPKKD